MRARHFLRFVPCIVPSLLANCSSAVGTSDASDGGDASEATDAVPMDGAPAAAGRDVTTCMPATGHLPGVPTCDQNGLAQCAAWAQAQTITGVAYSVCATHAPQC